MEIERKWLLDYKVIPWQILKVGNYKTEKFIQQYIQLPTENNPYEKRIRKIISDECVKYYKTTKSYNENNGIAREEKEEEITQEEFNTLFNPDFKNIIEKIRHSVTLEGITYEIDQYIVPEGLAIVEVEFDSLEAANSFKVPSWFNREVTQDSKYKNVNLARNGL